MGNVLIRDIPEADLDLLKQAAADAGLSMQAYLLRTLSERALYERRLAALRRIEEYLEGRPPLTDEDRAAIREAMDHALDRE